MASVEELRQRLKRPLKLEQVNGYQNNAVVGGLESLLNTVGKPFADVQKILQGYSSMDLEERREHITQALALLELPPSQNPSQNLSQNPSQKTSTNQTVPPSQKNLLCQENLDTKLNEKIIDLGAQAARKLSEIGIMSYRDLLYTFPKRYEDRRALPYFAALGSQDVATISGLIVSKKAIRSKKGMVILRVSLEDKYQSKLTAVWFNQPWLEKQLYPGLNIIVTGKVKQQGNRKEINVSDFEIDDDKESLSHGRIVGIYASTQGLSQAYIRRAIYRLLENTVTLPDYLPKKVLLENNLTTLNNALRHIHLPNDEVAAQQALRRLKFDEFLFLELRILLNRDTASLGKSFKVKKKTLKAFTESLPFKLTNAQKRVLDEILADMQNLKQMARLLQGDVGSGKTAVAAAALYVAVDNKTQGALMAPTEILARQHFSNLQQYLFSLGVKCELLVGSMTKKQADNVREKIASGDVDVIVGTQALIQESITFHNLGLVVIDEEHRFGVEQRRKLLAELPDVLVMSATPIPRSLALTMYGDLELSTIDELPPGRKTITTRLVSDKKRRDVYRFAWGEIQKGRQVYVVTPLIEESEAEVMAEIVSAEQMYEDLCSIMPKSCRIDILHGRMSGKEKEAVMESFRQIEFDMLVSTTVIEVGVDVPNASLMVIENAERFGLSQLHQLRGRVGRGEYESYCILIAGDRSKKTQQRLEVIEKYSDGFVIAEKDLELRGPGEMRGTRQSGLPDLVLGDLTKDSDIIEKSRELAKKMLEADAKLEAKWAERLRAELKRRVDIVGLREVI